VRRENGGGYVRGTAFERGNRKISVVKLPTQYPLVIIMVRWKEGKVLGS
jgi:hypothetical protein